MMQESREQHSTVLPITDSKSFRHQCTLKPGLRIRPRWESGAAVRKGAQEALHDFFYYHSPLLVTEYFGLLIREGTTDLVEFRTDILISLQSEAKLLYDLVLPR